MIKRQRDNAAASGFPHFSGQSEMRPKVNEIGSHGFSLFVFVMAALGKFSMFFGPGKVSL